MDQNQCSAAGATCKYLLTWRSRSIPRTSNQQGDPYKMAASDPAEDNRSTGEGLAGSGDI